MIHGPMWQFECEDCSTMGEVWPSRDEALAERDEHDCLEVIRGRALTAYTQKGKFKVTVKRV